jgi:hemoglobin-like flavoprotein
MLSVQIVRSSKSHCRWSVNTSGVRPTLYRHMFAEHSEPLDGIFNRGNQARDEQQQALADRWPPSRAAQG